MREEKQVLIRGERIQLRAAVKEDMKLKVMWYNDPEVNRTLVLPEKLELKKTYEWFERAQQGDSREDWIIETLDGKAIGLIGIKEINKNNNSGLLYIVIGEKNTGEKVWDTKRNCWQYIIASSTLNCTECWAAHLKIIRRVSL
jgi:RimJ/RimL family protein N-acetyltransferase